MAGPSGFQDDLNSLSGSLETPEIAPVVILGGGPAGLTAAWELSRHSIRSTVLEKDAVVGGLSRTAEYKGYLFDIGGHRFFTKVGLVEDMWREVLGDDLLERPRLSRIYYKSKFFHYPLRPLNALFGLGPIEAVRCGLSYLKARLMPVRPEDNFEAWVSNRFGRRLFKIFFESYTEKVWGMPCRQIGAEWAAQRIKGLSLTSVLWNALRPKKRAKGGVIKTLIHEFLYPRRGPGQMWTRTSEIVAGRGSHVVLNAPVEKIYWEPGRVHAVTAGGRLWVGEYFVSSLAIRDLIARLHPEPPEYLRAAMDDFHYRDFLTVALIIHARDLFPDNWIYVHEPGVQVGRIQNYKNWSPEMVPDSEYTCLGLEYFCFEGDGLWTSSDQDLVARAVRELDHLGLARPDQVVDGTVVRMPKAYPVYDDRYQRGVAAVRRFLETVPNLQLVGRNGMHRYNNQDHSMLTAMLAARNIINSVSGLATRYDLWRVNVDGEYHEDGQLQSVDDLAALESTQPMVPRLVVPEGQRPDETGVFSRVNR